MLSTGQAEWWIIPLGIWSIWSIDATTPLIFKKIARNVAKRLEGQQNSHSPGMCPFLSSAHQILFTKISWIRYCEESFSMPLIHPWFLESRSNKYLKNLINIKGIHLSNRSQNIHYFVNFRIWAPALISFLNHQQRQQTAPGCDFLSQLWLNDGLQNARTATVDFSPRVCLWSHLRNFCNLGKRGSVLPLFARTTPPSFTSW